MTPAPPRRPVVFPAVAAAAVILTVSWWRDWMPLDPVLRPEPAPLSLAASHLGRALLHLDPLHLVFNLYWLYAWIPVLERRHGPVPVAAALAWLAVGSGAVASAAGEHGVGLSGVVYGLLGFAWVTERRLPPGPRIATDGNLRFFAGWFALCLVTTWAGLWRVGNVAHGSGAILGLALGWIDGLPRGVRAVGWVAVPALAVLVEAALAGR